MGNLPTFTPQEYEIFEKFHKGSTPQGEVFQLNPNSDKDHQQLIEMMLRACDKNSGEYPYLYKAMSTKELIKNIESQKIFIASAGIDSNGLARANTWLSNDQPTLFSGGSLFVFDSSEQLLSFGFNSNVKSGFLLSNTDQAELKKINGDLKVLGVNYVVTPEGYVTFVGISGTRKIDLTLQSPKMNIQDPVNSVSHPAPNQNWIVIALGRAYGSKPPDVDYYYSESQNSSAANFIIPFVGNYTVPYEIDTSKSIILSSYINVTYADGTSEQINLITQPTNQITVGTDSKTVSWSFPYDSLGYAATTSLVYGTENTTDLQSAVFFQFQVPLLNAPFPTYSFEACTNPGVTPPANCTPLPYFKFTWHCLAEGTKVRLHDNCLSNIETLTSSDRVLTGAYGANIAVEATTRGYYNSTENHKHERGIYKLRTASGKEIIATGTHPIMTPTGPMMICFLQKDNEVLVIDGKVEKIDSCEPITYEGKFYDLLLGNAEDRTKGASPHHVHSYYANDILVGDHRAMNAHVNHQRFNLDFVLPRIKPDFHTDYISAVKHHKY